MLGDFITRLLVYVLFPTFPSFVHLSKFGKCLELACKVGWTLKSTWDSGAHLLLACSDNPCRLLRPC